MATFSRYTVSKRSKKTILELKLILNKAIYIYFFICFFCQKSSGQENCYVICNTKLYKLQPTVCNAALIGNTGIGLLDIAICPSKKLYGTDGTQLFEIDTLTAALSFVGNIGIPLAEIYNNLMAINNEFLIAQNSNLQLIKFNITTGEKIVIGTLSYYSSGDITFYEGYYYLSATGNQLVKIKLNHDETVIISEQLVGTMDTQADNVYGAVSIGNSNCEKAASKIYAFENYDLYEIDAENANAVLLCDTVFLEPATGAASLNEVYALNSNEFVDVPNVFTPNNDGVNDVFDTNLKLSPDFLFQIYNRWGVLVFESNKHSQWNGDDIGGNICGDGIYYYVLSFQNVCGKIQSEKGFIQLFK